MSDQASHESNVLTTAWRRFATYDQNANAAQRRFVKLRVAMLAAGIAATVLAVIYSELVQQSSGRPAYSDWRFYLWLPMVTMPILGSVLAAGSSKLARGVDWIHFRGAAEAIKREIYRYRCGIGGYGGKAAQRNATLADAVGQVTERLMDSDAVNTTLMPYRGRRLPPPGGACEDDDGFSSLGPEQYLEWRLADQLAYFRQKSQVLYRRHRQFQWTVAILGGIGTLMAVLGQEIWVPVSVAVATALVSYLELRSVETNLASYNRSALGLDGITTWWRGLSDEAKDEPASFAALIERTESLLGAENASWMVEMKHAAAGAAKWGKA